MCNSHKVAQGCHQKEKRKKFKTSVKITTYPTLPTTFLTILILTNCLENDPPPSLCQFGQVLMTLNQRLHTKHVIITIIRLKKVRTTLKCSISHKFIQNLPFQSFYWQSVPLEFRLNTIFPLFDKLAWTPSLHMLLSKIKFKIFMWILGWPPPSYLCYISVCISSPGWVRFSLRMRGSILII